MSANVLRTIGNISKTLDIQFLLSEANKLFLEYHAPLNHSPSNFSHKKSGQTLLSKIFSVYEKQLKREKNEAKSIWEAKIIWNVCFSISSFFEKEELSVFFQQDSTIEKQYGFEMRGMIEKVCEDLVDCFLHNKNYKVKINSVKCFSSLPRFPSNCTPPLSSYPFLSPKKVLFFLQKLSFLLVGEDNSNQHEQEIEEGEIIFQEQQVQEKSLEDKKLVEKYEKTLREDCVHSLARLLLLCTTEEQVSLFVEKFQTCKHGEKVLNEIVENLCDHYASPSSTSPPFSPQESSTLKFFLSKARSLFSSTKEDSHSPFKQKEQQESLFYQNMNHLNSFL